MKNKIVNILVILIISLITLTIGVKAANLISASEITYNDTTVQDALDELMEIAIQCPDNALCSEVNVGDYVSMTPTETTYTIPGELTGYVDTTTGEYIDQTINPSELNLWRVIAINLDGTIDMVSEYVSSTNVTFYGLEGYLNYVGTLNTIANQYGNSKYTIRTRHMGYSGQTATLNSLSKTGDGGYSIDTELVKTAISTLLANKVGTTSKTSYWIPSRSYSTYAGGAYEDYVISYSATHMGGNIHANAVYMYHNNTSSSFSSAIRPIVTLKSTIDTYTGSGTSDEPWVLS